MKAGLVSSACYFIRERIQVNRLSSEACTLRFRELRVSIPVCMYYIGNSVVFFLGLYFSHPTTSRIGNRWWAGRLYM